MAALRNALVAEHMVIFKPVCFLRFLMVCRDRASKVDT